MFLSKKSKEKLVGVHPDIVFLTIQLMYEMKQRKSMGLQYTDFSVFETWRTIKKQKDYITRGVSWTLKSKHLIGEAIDLVVYIKGVGLTWDDKKYKKEWSLLTQITTDIINKYNLDLTQGAYWKHKDKPHIQTKRGNIDITKNIKRINQWINMN